MISTRHSANSHCRQRRTRRGAATVWIILMVPLLILALGVVIEIVHLWLARTELENSLEAAALAAVKEWGGDNGQSGTILPRNIGVEFAQLNVINGVPVEIGPNLGTNPTNNPNLNKLCVPQLSDMNLATTPRPNGNLIFGAIIEQPNGTLIFDATMQPSCGCACDVTVQAAGNQDQLKACGGWTVCFENCEAGAMVTSLVIELPPGHKPGAHLDTSGVDFTCNTPTVTPASVTFSPLPNPETVTIVFNPPLDPTNFSCNALNPLKFGLGLNGYGSSPCGGSGNGAANLWDDGVRVTITFDVNGNTDTCSGVFQNPAMVCTEVAVAELSGDTGKDFGVMAKGLVQVQPIFSQFAGLPIGPFNASAITTARYRCETGQVELVPILPQNVICSPGNGADP